eukprot:2254925-Alexandrium_andersonii.AAC.1
MSASLVGSEMCIRDRPLHPAFHATPERPVAGRPGRGMELQRLPLELQAVSYTHLTLPTICSV